jgi:hypothetical protein
MPHSADSLRTRNLGHVGTELCCYVTLRRKIFFFSGGASKKMNQMTLIVDEMYWVPRNLKSTDLVRLKFSEKYNIKKEDLELYEILDRMPPNIMC